MSIQRNDQMMTLEEFTEKVKQEGTTWGSISHYQAEPCEIDQWAILEWQYDVELFAITSTGKRVTISEQMPGMYEYYYDQKNSPIDNGGIE